MMATLDAYFKVPVKVNPKKVVVPEDVILKEGSTGLEDSFELFEDPKPRIAPKGREPKKSGKQKKEKSKKKKSDEKDGDIDNGPTPSKPDENKCATAESGKPIVKDTETVVSPKSNQTFMTYADFIQSESTKEDSNKNSVSQVDSENNTSKPEKDIPTIPAVNVLHDEAEDEGLKIQCNNSKKENGQDSQLEPIEKQIEAPDQPNGTAMQNDLEILPGDTEKQNDNESLINAPCAVVTTDKKVKKQRKKKKNVVQLKQVDDTILASLEKLQVNEEEEEPQLALPEKPQANSMFKYFSKCSKSFASIEKLPRKPVEVKVEIHKEPPFTWDTLKVRNEPEKSDKSPESRRKSNVIVDSQDLSIVTLEASVDASPIKPKRKSPKRIILVEKTTSKGASKNLNQLMANTDTPGDVISLVDGADEKEEGRTKEDIERDEQIALLERKKAVQAQMESLDKIKVSSTAKSTQMTLCFGQGSFSVQKPVKPPPESIDEDDTKATIAPEEDVPKDKYVDINEDSDPVVVVDESSNQTDAGEVESKKRKRPSALESIYKASLTKPSGSRSLKMTFKRTRRQGSDEDFSPKSQMEKAKTKIKAKELVKRAKKGRPNARRLSSGKAENITPDPSSAQTPDNSEVVEAGLRRSSRRSAQVAKESISLQSDSTSSKKVSKDVQTGEENVTKAAGKKSIKSKSNKKSPKNTPVKTKKSTKVPAKALASIFNKKSRQESTESVVSVSSGDDVEITAVELDPAKLESQRVRRMFLMSGVPEKLKQKQAEAAEVKLDDYPPLPSTSHVQQMGDMCVPERPVQDTENNKTNKLCQINPWELGDVSLPLKPSPNIGDPINAGDVSQFWSLVKSGRQLSIASNVKCVANKEKVVDDVVKFLLAEINTANVLFPVRRMYRQLVYRRQENLKEEDSAKTEHSSQTDSQSTQPGKEDKPDTAGGGDGRERKGKKRRKESDDADVVILEEEPAPKRSTRARGRLTRKKSQDAKVEEKPCAPVELGKGDNCQKDTNAQEVPKPKNEGQTGMLWTDKYSPGSSSEMVGNSKAVKKMKAWLQEWKQRTDLEAKKLRKQQVRQAKKDGKTKEEIQNSFGEDWWDDDSDFDFGSDSEEETEEEDDCLCNTVLLTGRSGIGKSCLVQALAKELGYKVFEVNAASRRNGKQILSQLQEATQSHQVSKRNLDAMYTTAMMIEKNGASAVADKTKPSKQEKKLPTAFSNLFGKASKTSTPNVKTESTTKESKTRNKKEEKKQEKLSKTKSKKPKEVPVSNTPRGNFIGASQDEQKKGLDLASTSLILFEEVDLVFEEDKGFWCAVQTFMATTKRPILLTANDPKFSEKFKAKMEQHHLRAPPPANIASYLQVIALAENYRTEYQDLLLLAEHHQSDVRACLLALQYWCTSGASTMPASQPIQYRQKFLKDRPLLIGPGGDCGSPIKPILSPKPGCRIMKIYNSPEDFRMRRPRNARSRRLIIEDDSSCDRMSPVKLSGSNSRCPDSPNMSMIDEDELSQASSQENVSSLAAIERPLDLASRPVDNLTPQMQVACFRSLTSFACVSAAAQNDLYQILRSGSIGDLSETLSVYISLGHDILYPSVNHLLPLPKCAFSTLKIEKAQKPRRRRIITGDDLFDSDGSEDAFVSLPKNDGDPERVPMETTSERPPNVNHPTSAADESPPLCDASLCQKTLSSLAAMYDNFSAADTCRGETFSRDPCAAASHVWCQGTLTPGDTDSSINVERGASSSQQQQHWAEWAGAVESRAYLGARAEMADIMSRVEELDELKSAATKEAISLPVDQTFSCTHVTLTHERKIHASLRASSHRAIAGVAKSLPCQVTSQRRAIPTDYMPTIRAIFLSEQMRKVEKTKRRFFHHLDDFLRELKESDIDTLCSSFD